MLKGGIPSLDGLLPGRLVIGVLSRLVGGIIGLSVGPGSGVPVMGTGEERESNKIGNRVKS